MKRTLTPTLVAAAVLALAGCGTDGDGLTATQTATDATATAGAPKLNENQTADAAQAALYRDFGTWQSGDLRAVYALMAKDCAQVYGSFAEFETLFAESIEAVETITGHKLSEMRLGDVEVVEFTPERALLKSNVYLADGTRVLEDDDWEEPEPEVLVYEDGEWRSACTDPSDSDATFETVGEEIEMTTTVTTVPPGWTAPSTTIPGRMSR